MQFKNWILEEGPFDFLSFRKKYSPQEINGVVRAFARFLSTRGVDFRNPSFNRNEALGALTSVVSGFMNGMDDETKNPKEVNIYRISSDLIDLTHLVNSISKTQFMPQDIAKLYLVAHGRDPNAFPMQKGQTDPKIFEPWATINQEFNRVVKAKEAEKNKPKSKEEIDKELQTRALIFRKKFFPNGDNNDLKLIYRLFKALRENNPAWEIILKELHESYRQKGGTLTAAKFIMNYVLHQKTRVPTKEVVDFAEKIDQGQVGGGPGTGPGPTTITEKEINDALAAMHISMLTTLNKSDVKLLKTKDRNDLNAQIVTLNDLKKLSDSNKYNILAFIDHKYGKNTNSARQTVEKFFLDNYKIKY